MNVAQMTREQLELELYRALARAATLERILLHAATDARAKSAEKYALSA